MEISISGRDALYDAMRVTGQMRAPEAMKQEHVGERLRAIREANDLKPSEMAALLGVERTYWTRWEKGKRPIPNDAAWKLTQKFPVDLDYILSGDTKSVPADVQMALRIALARKPAAS